jgi:hypothetical protein
MIGDENRMTTSDAKPRAVLARDAALVRLSRTRRWIIAGTAALTAGSAALVSVVAPGRSLASKQPAPAPAAANPSSSSSSSSSSIPRLPPAASPSSLGLQGPDQPPQSIPSPPQESSPAPSAPQSAPQPAPQSSGGGGVVSGGS